MFRELESAASTLSYLQSAKSRVSLPTCPPHLANRSVTNVKHLSVKTEFKGDHWNVLQRRVLETILGLNYSHFNQLHCYSSYNITMTSKPAPEYSPFPTRFRWASNQVDRTDIPALTPIQYSGLIFLTWLENSSNPDLRPLTRYTNHAQYSILIYAPPTAFIFDLLLFRDRGGKLRGNWEVNIWWVRAPNENLKRQFWVCELWGYLWLIQLSIVLFFCMRYRWLELFSQMTKSQKLYFIPPWTCPNVWHRRS